ncbi:D-arabinono-1,4-lactone oxidase [Rhodococcoides kyotonense]|uniref:FAD/FMN-containing dehydrogenase n=1 Tax=Rhodococcoides kyotonense TaxID=398843 RepID=A0A239N892_9NOCA|nr:D-arabinono-1,4-lactone oxidase [Rhodococcus kyotonensis]SNT50713.1 FAD/FMN-containing dehydrogenase [Rhodococcus kyotonensis]
MHTDHDTTWTNWGGNHTSAVRSLEIPADEQEAITAIRSAVGSGRHVSVAGGGHSFTPIVDTSDTLFDLSRVSGIIDADPVASTVEVYAGSKIADLGLPLWERGLAIANQGDIDAQSIAGAVATGTKGSGTTFGSMSSTVRSVRLVDAHGDVVDIGPDDTDLLHAAQVSVGMLGPVLRLGLDVVPAYRLREENVVMHIDEMFDRFDDLHAEYRHFSFWWMPTDASSALYELGDVPANHCFVKLLREIPESDPEVPVGELNKRTDRAYRIYPDGTTEAQFHELEYMVDAADTREVVDMMRDLMTRRFPEEISPLQVRWQKGDQGFLSPQYGRDSASISVSGERYKNYGPFLEAVDKALLPFGARPHWGKLHFLTPDRVREIYPRFDDFQQVRRHIDPQGLYLNDHLRPLFG